MVQALYIMGLIYGENFVVQRNWPVAYGFFKQAADQGFEPARAVAAELLRRGLDSTIAPGTIAPDRKRPPQESARPTADTTFNFVFVDFATDTVSTVPDTTLLRESVRSMRRDEDRDDAEALTPADSALRQQIVHAADNANPEALCVIGRLYERGIGVSRDLVLAGTYYLRALRLESYRAGGLLWKLMQTEDFLHQLRTRSDRGEGDEIGRASCRERV
jgi:TPR repeat protein